MSNTEATKTDANEIVKSLPWLKTQVVKGSARWDGDDVIRVSYKTGVTSSVCRHNDWRSVCGNCSGGPVRSEEGRDPEEYENSPSNPDNVPLWHPGERKAYDSDSGDGIHTFAELIEIEDDLKHAYDY